MLTVSAAAFRPVAGRRPNGGSIRGSALGRWDVFIVSPVV